MPGQDGLRTRAQVNLHYLLATQLSHSYNSENFKSLSKRFLLLTVGVSCVDRKTTVIRDSFLLSLQQSSILSCTPPPLTDSEDFRAKADGTGVNYDFYSKTQTYLLHNLMKSVRAHT